MRSNFLEALQVGAVVIALFVLAGSAVAQPAALSVAAISAMVDKNELVPALKAVDQLLAREPSNTAAHTQRARILLFQNKCGEARVSVAKALNGTAGDAAALNVRALCERADKNYDEAMRTLNAALAADPKFYKALRNRAGTRADRNEPLDAVLKDYDDFLKVYPDDVSTLRLAGDHCLMRSGPAAKCASYFGKIRSLTPSDHIGYLGSAMAYGNVFATVTDRSILTGQVTNDFKKAIELDPKNAVAHLQYGRLLLNLGDHVPCIERLTRAIELDAKSPWALAMRGDCYRLSKNHDLAIVDYTRSLELKANQTLVYRFMGDSLRATGRYGDMLNAYEKEVELDDYNRDAYERLNNAYHMNTDWLPRGQAFLQKLVDKNGKNVCSLEALGRMYGGSKSKDLLDRAINTYDGKNGKLCSANAAFWLGRVEADRVYGDWNLAMDYYEKALQIDPSLPYVRDWMAKIHRPGRTGRPSVAQSVKTEANRQAYVDRTYLEASNDIKARSDKFNAYNTESQNTLDTTAERLAELRRLKISEMTEIVNIAKRTMSDIGSEISQGGRDYLNRIITTGTQRLSTLQK